MRRALLILVAFFGLAAAPARAAGLPTTWCGSETATDDTADATFAKTQPQFKVVYVYPSDRPDRFAQWQDLIQADASQIDQFVSSQPGSTRAPRFDLGTACGPQYVDIESIPLPDVRASYVQDSYDVEWYVKRHVNLSPGGKRNYVIIADTLASGAENGYGEVYEGSSDSDRPDLSNEHNLGGLTSILFTPDAAAPAADPNGWWPEGVLHEMTHNLGGVQWSAPHSTQRHGYTDFTYSDCWDGHDIMCEQDGPDASHAYDPTVCAGSGSGAMPDAYDCNQDDYFNPSPSPGSYLATHWNIYNSVFMADCASLPAGACVASGPTDPPLNVVAPSIAGAAATGQLLSGSNGGWSPGGASYAYQWLRDGVVIRGATATTYRVTTADIGAVIALRVTAANPYGSVIATSAGVGPSLAQPPVDTTPPAVTGSPTASAVLTSSTGVWSPAATSYAFQWEHNLGAGFVDIPGASASTYRVSTGESNALIRVRVTARNADGTSSAVSGAVGPVSVPTPVNTVVPKILGAAKTQTTLTATIGQWNPGGTGYTIQWERDTGSGFTDVPGAKLSTYRLGTVDRGARIRLRITAVNGPVSTIAYSSPLGPVISQPPVNTVLPKVLGSVLAGATLTGTTGTWNPAGTSYSYQWLRDGGSGFMPVTGQTRTVYKLTSSDVGTKLALRVTANNPDGTSSVDSLVFGPVLATAAAATVRAGATAPVKSASGAVLASATVGGAHAATVTHGVRVIVRRAHRARGKLKVTVCGATCSTPRALGSRAVKVTVAPTAAGRVSILLGR